jgi:hypothetical protein
MKTLNKKYLGIKLWVLLLTTTILTVIISMLIAKSKKKKFLMTECRKRGGVWSKEESACVIPPVTPPDNNGGNDGSGSTDLTWSPNVLASEIATNLEGLNFMVHPEIGEKVLALNDAQLTNLYSYYNKTHAVDYPTLTLLFANEWDNEYFGKSKYDMVVDRLRGLGLQ